MSLLLEVCLDVFQQFQILFLPRFRYPHNSSSLLFCGQLSRNFRPSIQKIAPRLQPLVRIVPVVLLCGPFSSLLYFQITDFSFQVPAVTAATRRHSILIQVHSTSSFTFVIEAKLELQTPFLALVFN